VQVENRNENKRVEEIVLQREHKLEWKVHGERRVRR
jgi:hypothetical protein